MTALPPDFEVLERYARTGAREDLTPLVTRYVDLVYAAARRQLADPHAAADVTQQVFVILMRKAARLPLRTVLASWLLKVTAYECRNFRKSESRRARRERAVAAMKPESHPAPSATAAAAGPSWDDLAPHLDDALAQLNPGDRDAVVLKYFHSRSAAEAAAALGATEASVRQRVYRGLNKIRGYLSERGVITTEAALAAALLHHAATPAAAPAAIAAATLQAVATAPAKVALTKGALILMTTHAKALLATAALCFAAGVVLTLAWPRQPAAPVNDAPHVVLVPDPSPRAPATAVTAPPKSAAIKPPAPIGPKPPPPVVRGPRKLFDVIAARTCDELHGPQHGYDFLGYINKGDWVKYADVDLGPADAAGPLSFCAVLSCPPEFAGHDIQVHLDAPDGPLIATLMVESSGGHGTFTPQIAPVVQGAAGVNDIFLVFTGGGFNVKSIKFVLDGRPADRWVNGTSYGQADRVNEGGPKLVNVRDGAWARYDGLDFGPAGGVGVGGAGRTIDAINLTYAVDAAHAGGTISVRLARADAPPIATVPIVSTGGYDKPVARTYKLSAPVTGHQDVYLTFTGQNKGYFGLADVHGFRFKVWEPGDAAPPPATTLPAASGLTDPTTRPATRAIEPSVRKL